MREEENDDQPKRISCDDWGSGGRVERGSGRSKAKCDGRVAVEIPVYLTKEDIAYYRGRGFTLDFESDFITGHIDFLQVRDGYLQILDYKPDARKEKHAHVQLTIYALALARRANLPLKNFKCAWFDEKDYFEFFPPKGVYRPKARPELSPPPFRGTVVGQALRASDKNVQL